MCLRKVLNEETVIEEIFTICAYCNEKKNQIKLTKYEKRRRDTRKVVSCSKTLAIFGCAPMVFDSKMFSRKFDLSSQFSVRMFVCYSFYNITPLKLPGCPYNILLNKYLDNQIPKNISN